MRKKLKDSSGLTLVETLCATVILVLLCLVMNVSMQMALADYRALTGEAETQVLLSSLSDALADKLRYCVVTESKVPPQSIGEVGVSIDHQVTVGGEKLLPEGAYGEPDAAGNRRYQVVEPLNLTTVVSGSVPVFTVTLEVKDTQTDISKETVLTVRCLNPVKKEGPP